MKLGCARARTSEQVLDLQLDALRQAGGQLVVQIFCALAGHERDVLVQRTHAGLQAARGRPPGLAPRYQKIAPAVKGPYKAGPQSTRQRMNYF